MIKLMPGRGPIGDMPDGANIRLGDSVIRIVAPSIASQGLAIVVVDSMLRLGSADCFPGCILSAYNARAKPITTRATGKRSYCKQRCYHHDAKHTRNNLTGVSVLLMFHFGSPFLLDRLKLTTIAYTTDSVW